MKFEDLTDYQIDVLGLNGCGAKSSIVKPPYAVFFKSSCYKHDLSYIQGGSEEDRLEADTGFLRAMLQDCERVKNKISKYKYVSWAYLYFLAVRLEGWKHFEYRHEKLSIERLLGEHYYIFNG